MVIISLTQERKKLEKRKYSIGKFKKKINKNNITRNELIEVRESARYTVDNFAIKSNERNFLKMENKVTKQNLVSIHEFLFHLSENSAKN